MTASEWLTIYERRHSAFEFFLVHILLGPKQIKKSLRKPGWSYEYKVQSKPKIIISNRSAYLGKAFERLTGARKQKDGPNYEDSDQAEIIRYKVTMNSIIISMRKDIIWKFINDQERFLLLGVQSTRLSERTLNELGMEDGQRLDFFSNPMPLNC